MKFYVAFFICLLSLSIAAQQPASPKAPSPPAAPQAPSAPVAPVTVVPPDQEQGGQPVNIRLDVSVADQAANSALLPKTLMVMLVDRGMGRTRAAFQDRFIAVDARPVIVDNRIRVYVTIQSEATRGFGPPSPSDDHTINWRNSFSLLLENGKPMLALETSDAVTKRKMSIEVKATIQK
jgi:hypothetical protein